MGTKRAYAGTTTHAVTRLGPGKIDWRHFGEIQITSNNPFFDIFKIEIKNYILKVIMSFQKEVINIYDFFFHKMLIIF